VGGRVLHVLCVATKGSTMGLFIEPSHIKR
jgi:hypothetical protein